MAESLRFDPDAVMDGPLGELLSANAAERAALVARAVRVRNGFLLGAAATAGGALLLGAMPISALILGAFVGGAGFAVGELIMRRTRDRIKAELNRSIAASLGFDYQAEAEGGSAFERAKAFGMVPRHQFAHFQDRWWGALSGQPFELFEAKLTLQAAGEKHKVLTMFEGAIMRINSRRGRGPTILIEPKGSRDDKGGTTIGGHQLEPILLEDRALDRRFTAWSNDKIRALTFLGPQFGEGLTRASEDWPDSSLRILFSGSELLVTLGTGDQFETASLDARDDAFLVEQTLEQLGDLLRFLGTLNGSDEPSGEQA